jgi:hypothetical protein
MLDILLITDVNSSLHVFGDRLRRAGWNVTEPRPSRLVASRGYPEAGDEYIAIEEGDDIRREYEEDEWRRVIEKINAPRIFYIKYRDRPLVREALSNMIEPGMLIDESDRLIEATDFS